jgi:hypothetical protein
MPLTHLFHATAVDGDLVGFEAVITGCAREDVAIVGDSFIRDDHNFLTHFKHGKPSISRLFLTG